MQKSELEQLADDDSHRRNQESQKSEYKTDYTSSGASEHLPAGSVNFETQILIDEIRALMKETQDAPVTPETHIASAEELAEVVRKALQIHLINAPLPDYIQVEETLVTKNDLQKYMSKSTISRH